MQIDKIKFYLNNVKEDAKDQLIIQLLIGDKGTVEFAKKCINEFYKLYSLRGKNKEEN